jgi:hypothetical protein
MNQALARAAAGDCPSDDLIGAIGQVSAFLSDALAIADLNDLSPEIGARLEELINRVEQELADRKFARAIVSAWSQASPAEE